jgi:hypothetical protein
MNFPRVDSDLRNTPERVRSAILGGEIEPYFKQSGWLTQGGTARWIKWQPLPDGSLEGKLGYFRSKNLCVFRFKAELQPLAGGSRVTLLAQHGPFSPFLRFLLYAIGICMCVVGVVFSYLGDQAIQRGLSKVVENLQRHLTMWDQAT